MQKYKLGIVGLAWQKAAVPGRWAPLAAFSSWTSLGDWSCCPPKKTNLLAGKATGQRGGGGGYTTGPGLLELEPWSLGTQKAALR